MSTSGPTIRSHRQFDAVLAAMEVLKHDAQPWSGTGYRLASVSYATPEQLLSGAGSETFGSRWNAPGTFSAVYCSLLPETAVSETMHRFRRSGLKPRSPLPGILVAIRIRLRSVIDFTEPKATGALGSYLAKAAKENWQELNDQGRESLSQAIGRATHQLKVDGLLFLSAVVPDAQNIVIFPGNLRAKSALQIENEASLRKHVHE